MWSKAKQKRNLGIVGMVLIALLPVVSLKLFGGADRMTMYYDDNKQMEREILRKVPTGSTTQFARQVMSKNGFLFSKQTGSSLMFDKEESYWPFGFGTIWTAEIIVSKGVVTNAKVGIEPAD